MHRHVGQLWLCCALVATAAGCQDSSTPTTELAIAGPAAFHGYVTASTLQQFISPEGPVSQYEIRMHKALPDTGDAGVFIGAAAGAVYLSSGAGVTSVTAEAVTVGDSLLVWTDGTVAHGQDGFPVTTPIYGARQLVIARTR